ncbi:hypothetical protein ACFC6U_39955, partial [Kitasatospora purpeofusca]|uniref:hypothetical protein n=1 Tax=Kitasatospora purpeofusca TaxID=67352 RepID=UPI0035D6B0E6
AGAAPACGSGGTGGSGAAETVSNVVTGSPPDRAAARPAMSSHPFFGTAPEPDWPTATASAVPHRLCGGDRPRRALSWALSWAGGTACPRAIRAVAKMDK